jgi:pantoate--beta-alanine ligase
MQIIKSVSEMNNLQKWWRGEGRAIGFVPTMGALHEGHLSLIRRSKEENDRTVVSIFVNPAQFGPHEDLQKYPRSIELDLEKLYALHADAVFMPDESEMYPEGYSTSIDMGDMGMMLCGSDRPGHFNGVATVVAKLFNIIMPHRAYFGQKDFQQSVVIKKLVREMNFPVDIVVCPIVREPEGLAMSSRNAYLSEEERKASLILYRALKLGEELINSRGLDDTSAVKKEMEKLLKSEPLVKIDYVDIVDPHSLDPIQRILFAGAICIAVKIGNTRLIDNIVVER